MSNPATQAASIVRVAPGTMAVALVGLTALLLGLDAARWAAGKVKVGLANVQRTVVAPMTGAQSTSGSGGF